MEPGEEQGLEDEVVVGEKEGMVDQEAWDYVRSENIEQNTITTVGTVIVEMSGSFGSVTVPQVHINMILTVRGSLRSISVRRDKEILEHRVLWVTMLTVGIQVTLDVLVSLVMMDWMVI